MHASISLDDRKGSGGIPAPRLALIERIVRAAAGRAYTGTRPATALLRSYFRGVGEEDLESRTPGTLAAAARGHFKLAARRMPGQALVEVLNPAPARDGFDSRHTVVRIVTDDMPFLVGSLGVVFSRAALSVHLIVHPVLTVRRDARGRLVGPATEGSNGHALAESWQLYEVDRLSADADLERLQRDIETTLADVRAAVGGWQPMRAKAEQLMAELERNPPPVPPVDIAEARAFLAWMVDRSFVFLGYRHYKLQRGEHTDRLVPDEPSGLGVLAGAAHASRHAGTLLLRGEPREHARELDLLTLTKANSRSTVHRGDYLDYVGLKTFDAKGRVNGEHRFLGLWTYTAYQASPREIPVLRRKVQAVVERFGLDPASHDGKAVLNVLETYPRDELFQASVPDLVRIVRAVVNLYERRTVRVLARRDPYHRFYSCLVYVPRDRYNTEVRRRIEQIVQAGFGARTVESYVQISDASHARLQVIVRTDPQTESQPDLAQLEASIAQAALTWADQLQAVLVLEHGEEAGRALAARYAQVFPPAYTAAVSPQGALADLEDLQTLDAGAGRMVLTLHRPPGEKPDRVHLRIARVGDPVPISDLLPVLENFGLRVIAERPYELAWPAGTAWLQDFELDSGGPLDLAQIAPRFHEALAGVWGREIENDGFNRLLMAAHLTARQILILRAYGRYLLQTGVPFSQGSLERTLAAHAPCAAALVQLFERRFDPAQAGRPAAEEARIASGIRESLQQVASLDEDRILRAYLALIEATLRTNHYQTDAAGQPHPYLSFKLDSARVPDLPLPRPKVEIFVHSPHVEGVHLRMGEVARGGIRWSDRPYDFRTEILGLMKAQNVKNTLIVPVGAKGGFVPRRIAGLARQEAQAEVVACYRTFIRGLLDLTDNLVAGKIVPPSQVVRHDGDDPYLVVAADKGTATFSDIANELSAEYGYWLGDAFASGGSAGYDHKKMAITARGAWECVKRHFREAGVDIQTTDFTVAGIGDMSGDVFGNGMLLSRHIRLQAAFDHRHIFLDPSPDPAVSFAERARLAARETSSWDDYDRQKISKGGGVFPRSAKSIDLSKEARALLSIDSPTATPQEVIRAILTLPVDLLWNGGIGTYVKAGHEASAEVGDKANDALRVNGRELRAKVVGEGGNLGFSQAGRIEYGQAGGRINTDFLDNSAGVNTSDIEVNLKILLNPQVAQGHLKLKDRDKLLARMTDDVAALVLRNNYLQSQALSIMELEAGNLPQWQALIRTLEREVQLDRAVEYLPDDEALAERAARGTALTRPELAVLLAYSKIWLNRRLLTSNLPEDVYFAHELERYFPAPLRRRFPDAISAHPLARQIITTGTTNSLVHRMGPAFVPRAQEETGSDPARIARAYTAAREILDMRALWEKVEAQDNKVPARLQYEIALASREVLRHVSYWLLARARRTLEVRATVDELRPGVQSLEETIGELLVGAQRERYERTRTELTQGGLPSALAARVACLPAYAAAPDLVEIAASHKVAVAEAARVYFEVDAQAGLAWLGQEVGRLPAAGAWQGIARQALADALLRTARRLAQAVLARKNGGHGAHERVAAWLAASDEWPRWQAMLAQMRTAGDGKADFATLSVGIETVSRLTSQDRNGG